MKIELYTDGAHSSATDVGGWAVVAVADNNILESWSNWKNSTTNNRMELMAVYEALCYISLNREKISQAIIYTDSAYIANAYRDKWYDKWQKNGWKTANKTDVLNQDLWQSILSVIYDITNIVSISKINGHMGHKYNELADYMAVEARKKGAKESGKK